MGLALLAPLFLLGLVAVAAPILVHLTQRDDTRAVKFPSLRFLRGQPYPHESRRRIRNWPLFLTRIAIVLLLGLAFARPLITGGPLAAGPGVAASDLVILLDRSASMGYGTTWSDALAAARTRLGQSTVGEHVSLIAFDSEAELLVRRTTDPGEVESALASLVVSDLATSFAPAIQAASAVLARSESSRQQVMLISDFQSRAWDRASRVTLPPGVALVTVPLVSDSAAGDVILQSVHPTYQRQAGREVLSLDTRLVNRGSQPKSGLEVSLVVDDREMASVTTDLAARSTSRVVLGPVAEPTRRARARVVIADGTLAADDTFHISLTPNPAIAMLLVSRETQSNLFLSQALGIESERGFEVLRRTPEAVRASDLSGKSLVVVHDAALPDRLESPVSSFLAGGGSLWFILGPASSSGNWANRTEWIAGTWSSPVDDVPSSGVSLATVEYRHPAFHLFEGSDQGDLSRARFFRYRTIIPHDSSQVIARFSDGAAALVERRLPSGGGVLMSAAPFDTRWSTLPLEPVFLPLVHQTVYALVQDTEAPPWFSAGDVIPLADVVAAAGLPAPESGGVIVESPTGQRRELTDSTAGLMPLIEAGFYEYYLLGQETASFPVAVNSDRSEFDLTRADPAEFAASVTSPTAAGDSTSTAAVALAPVEAEARQRVWWWLIALALIALMAESLLSHRVVGRQQSA